MLWGMIILAFLGWVHATCIKCGQKNCCKNWIVKDGSTIICSGDMLQVDQYLRVEGNPHIFAVGDVNNVPEQKLAFLAKKQAELTAKNLLAVIQAEEKGKTAKLSAWWPSAGMSVQFVSIGRRSVGGRVWGALGCVLDSYSNGNRCVFMSKLCSAVSYWE